MKTIKISTPQCNLLIALVSEMPRNYFTDKDRMILLKKLGANMDYVEQYEGYDD